MRYRRVKRRLAVLRREYPLLFFLPALVAGQLSAYYCSWQRWDLALEVYLLPLLAAAWLYRPLGLPTAAFLVGCLSMRLALPVQLDWPGAKDVVWTAVVDDTPRYPRRGLVRISLKVLDVLGPDESVGPGGALRDRRLLCQAVNLPWRNISGVRRGSILVLRGEVRALAPPDSIWDYQALLLRHNYSATCRIRYAAQLPVPADWRQRWLSRIKAAVYQAGGRGEAAELLLSMSLGVRDQLSHKTEWAFRGAGLAHLLVVSGYHVTLVFYACAWALRWLLLRSRRVALFLPVLLLSNLGAIAAAVLYVLISGVQGSSLRAILAAAVIMVAKLWERGGGMTQAILISFLCLALIWPGCWLEPGVQLTYAALTGIALGLSGRETAPGWQYLRICFLASLFTAVPVTAWFDRLSLVGFLLNPLLAPLAFFVCCKLGLIGIALQAAGLSVGGLLLRQCVALAGLFRDFIWWAVSWPGAAVTLSGGQRWYIFSALILIIGTLLWLRLQSFWREHNV